MKPRIDILTTLREEIAKETGLPASEVDDNASFYALGLDSISAVVVLDELERKTGIPMNPIYFWDYPSIALLAAHINSLMSHE